MNVRRETARHTLDRFSTFVAAGAWAAIVGGGGLIISLLLDWLVVPYEKTGDAAAYLTASYLVSSGLRLLSTVLLLWALLALYNRQSIAAGTFGLWGFVVAFFGTALFAGSVWAEAFVSPTLARVAPAVFTGQLAQAASLLIAKNLSAYLFSIGIVLFGLATLKAGVYPRWAAALLIISIPATIFLPNTEGTFSESIGQIMFGSAFMILGWHTLRASTSDRKDSERTAAITTDTVRGVRKS
jgi:hypothetical protein